MNQKFSPIYLSFALLFLAFIFISSKGNPPNGRTGAPGDGACTNCHGPGNAHGLDGNIEITGVPADISPNTTYPITVTVSNPNAKSLWAGFQMVALNSSNTNAGVMSNPSPFSVITQSNNRSYFEHNPAQDYGTNNAVSWTVDWTAPNVTGTESITFYAAGNIADTLSNSNTGNDLIVFDNVVTTLTGGNAIADLTVSNLLNWGGNYSPGEVVNYNFDLNNFGNEVAFGSFVINMYLSADQNLSADDQWAGEVPTGNTPVGTIAGVSGAITVPADFPVGNYYLIIVVDDGDVISELNELNNILVSENAIQVASVMASDLTVSNLSNWGGTYSPGEVVNYNFDLNNFGNEVAFGSFVINMYLSTDQNLSADDQWAGEVPTGNTPVGTIVGVSGAITIPVDFLDGNYYLIIVVDDGNVISESNELNNVLVSNVPLQVMMTEAIFVVINTVDVSCFDGTDGVATATISGGTEPYTYLWSNNNTEATIEGLPAGDYTVTVTDVNNFSATNTADIVEPEKLLVTLNGVSNFVCAGDGSGQISVSGTGGTTPYSYQWSNGATTATNNVPSGGPYNILITDGKGCTASQQYFVGEPLPIILNFFNTVSEVCLGNNNGATSVSAMGGTGNISYNWSDGTTGNAISELTPGTYMVTATDINGCTAVENFVVEETPPMTLLTESTEVTCNGIATGSASVSASGGATPYSYLWPNGTTNAMADFLYGGSHTVTVTDANNCVETATVFINEPPPITITFTDMVEAGCDNEATGSVTAVANGGTGTLNYIWSTGGTTATADFLVAGNYTVTVVDDNNCFTSSSVAVSTASSIELTFVNVVPVTCNDGADGAATATASGGSGALSYNWSIGADTQTISNLTAGVYFVTVSDEGNCSEVALVEIFEPNAIAVTVVNIENVQCPGDANGAASAEVLGGIPPYAFTWSTGSSNNLPAGEYSVMVTDGNGCTGMSDFSIGQEDTFSPVVNTFDISVALGGNGTVVIVPEMINSGSSDNCGIAEMFLNVNSFNCLDIGENIVMLTVVDAAGNSASSNAVVTVVDNTPPVMICSKDIFSTSCDPLEYDFPLVVDNCVDNVMLVMTSGLPSGAVFPVGETILAFEATDASGNVSNCSFRIIVENTLAVNLTILDSSCSGSNSGSASAAATGGNPGYSYLWSTGNTEPTITGLVPGDYSLTVTDVAGCISIQDFVIGEPPMLQITVDEITDATAAGNDGSIAVTTLGGTAPYSYSWLLNEAEISTQEDPTGLAPGVYTVLITDASGCQITSQDYTVEMMVGLKSISSNNIFTLYPNPATDVITLSWNVDNTATVSLNLYDMAGRQVFPKQTFQQGKIILDCATFQAGVYFVKINTEKHSLLKKIILVD